MRWARVGIARIGSASHCSVTEGSDSTSGWARIGSDRPNWPGSARLGSAAAENDKKYFYDLLVVFVCFSTVRCFASFSWFLVLF